MPDGEIELTFDPWPAEPLEREPVTLGVPFPPGAVPSPDEVRLFDGEAELYCQRQVLNSWPDGSLRWLLLDFQVDLPGATRKTLRIDYGRGPSQAVLTETGISLAEGRQEIVVDNGPLRLICRQGAFSVFDSVLLDGVGILASRESQGLRVVDLSGTAYTTTACRKATLTVESAGPLRAAIRVEGSHVHAARPLLDFSVLVTTWSDKPYAAVEYQIIHRGGEEVVELHEVAYSAAFTPREPVSLLADPADTLGGSHGLVVERSEDAVRIDIPAATIRGQTSPEAYLAAPWVSRAEGGRGFAVGVRHAVQQFPKRLVAGRQGISVALYPASDNPLRLHQGSAKSHEMLFHFFGGEADRGAIARRFQLFNLALRPRLPAAWYREAAAFGPLFPSRRLVHLDVALDEAFDNRPRALGMLHFGDEPHPIRNGEQPPGQPIIWSNNAYDLAHALFLHYARTGHLRHFAAAEAIVRHVIDLDHVHFSADLLRDGGLAAPDVDHCRHGRVTMAHQWVEGLLDYHHLTCCQQAFLTARRVGECVLRHVPKLVVRPPAEADPEELGWALYTVATLFRELGRPQYFDAARKLIDHLARCSSSQGGLATSFPPRDRFRIPSAIGVVLTGIQRYHDISQEERAADLFLGELDALLASADNPLCRPADFPAARLHLVANALLLEPLAYAHQLTGETRYLEVARPFVRFLILHGGLRFVPHSRTDHQRLIDDALIQRPVFAPAAGVHLALVVRPLLAYLAAAEAAGQLEPLGLEL